MIYRALQFIRHEVGGPDNTDGAGAKSYSSL